MKQSNPNRHPQLAAQPLRRKALATRKPFSAPAIRRRGTLAIQSGSVDPKMSLTFGECMDRSCWGRPTP